MVVLTDEGRVEINFDETVNESALFAGVGSILMNCKGQFIISYSAKVDIRVPLAAELNAMYVGLSFAIQQHITDVILEGDSASH